MFQLVDEFSVPFATNDRIVRYRHSSSKITLILHHCPGPKVSASIVVPTESLNDKGLPHTLEHLVFVGCDEIPYRGYIDTLSNRCFSAPCNAYTAEDHTCYQIDSVGPDGLINYLPVFLRFVLRPTLKDSDFLTEIYHIDGKGQEGGVVMCEMQSRENTAPDLLESNLARSLFSGTNLALSYGGFTEDIATLTNSEIQRYHGIYYHPDQITIVVQGCIDEPRLLDKMNSLEILPSPFFNESEPRIASWLQDFPPLDSDQHKLVKFPCQDESVGSVTIGWRGPSVFDHVTSTALSILIRYLNGISSSPLPHYFVHGTHSICSNISLTVQELKESKIVLEFSSVSVYQKDQSRNSNDQQQNDIDLDEKDEDENDEEDEEGEEDSGEEDSGEDEGNEEEEQESNLDSSDDDPNYLNKSSLYTRFVRVMEDIKKNGLKKEDILNAIEKESIKVLEGYEEDPLGFVFGTLLCDIVYPAKGAKTYEDTTNYTKDIKSRFNYLEYLESLKDKDRGFWCDLMDRWFLKSPHVEIILEPSSELATKQAEESLKKLNSRIETLGKDGLDELSKNLKKSIEDSQTFPDSYRSKLPSIPKVENIPFSDPPVRTLPPNSTDNPTGFTIQDVVIPTQFIQTTWFFYIKDLPVSLKPFLTIFGDLIFESDVHDSVTNKVMPFKKVVADISRETLSLDSGLGTNDYLFTCSYGEVYKVAGSSTVAQFDRLIYWIIHGILCFEPNLKRLKTTVSNHLKSLMESARDPSSICSEYTESLLVRDRSTSNNHAISIFKQKHFLERVLSELKNGNAEPTVNALREIRNYFASNSQRIFIQIGHNDNVDSIKLFENISALWNSVTKFCKINIENKRKNEDSIPYFFPYIKSPYGINSKSLPLNHSIEVLGSESNHITQAIEFPLDYHHPDFPPCLVYTDIFGLGETEIRTKGYAYGNYMAIELRKKIANFVLQDCLSPVKALEVFYNYIRNLKTSNKITQFEVESSISNNVFYFFNSRTTASELCQEAYLSIFKGYKCLKDEVNFINQIAKVTPEKLFEMHDKYFIKFVQPENNFIVMTTNPSSNAIVLEEMKSAFNFNFESKELNSLFEVDQ